MRCTSGDGHFSSIGPVVRSEQDQDVNGNKKCYGCDCGKIWQGFSVDHVIIQLSSVHSNGNKFGFPVSLSGAQNAICLCAFLRFLGSVAFTFLFSLRRRQNDFYGQTPRKHKLCILSECRKNRQRREAKSMGEPAGNVTSLGATFDHTFNRFPNRGGWTLSGEQKINAVNLFSAPTITCNEWLRGITEKSAQNRLNETENIMLCYDNSFSLYYTGRGREKSGAKKTASAKPIALNIITEMEKRDLIQLMFVADANQFILHFYALFAFFFLVPLTSFPSPATPSPPHNLDLTQTTQNNWADCLGNAATRRRNHPHNVFVVFACWACFVLPLRFISTNR